MLASAGVAGPAAADALAQARAKISPELLERAMGTVDQAFSRERLSVISPALQRNLDQFQVVRDLAIDDRIEPAPIFHARRSR
jgi:2-polyprenyl-6-methoxyphenol hydroxylase-like FAD-dependent oxidoreductase